MNKELIETPTQEHRIGSIYIQLPEKIFYLGEYVPVEDVPLWYIDSRVHKLDIKTWVMTKDGWIQTDGAIDIKVENE
jgi:hypothetical protein